MCKYLHIFLIFTIFDSVKTNKQDIMNILNFMWGFSDEASCIAYLKEQREQSGVVCRHYGGLKHRWDANKLCFECKHCHSRQSLRSGYHNRAFQASFFVTPIAAMFLSNQNKEVLSHGRASPPVGSQTLSTHLGDDL